jgi:Aminotransferase class I and II
LVNSKNNNFILTGIVENYKKDTFSGKIDLSVGAYRDDTGKPWVLPSVREVLFDNFINGSKADKLIVQSSYDYEYLPIAGYAGFIDQAVRLAYGDNCTPLKEKRIAAVQTLSGTGAIRVGLDLIKRFLGDRLVYVPNPTWPNHKNIAQDAGLQWKEYRYWNDKTKGLDFAGLSEDLSKAPEGSVIILHACAHNPTGKNHEDNSKNQVLTQPIQNGMVSSTSSRRDTILLSSTLVTAIRTLNTSDNSLKLESLSFWLNPSPRTSVFTVKELVLSVLLPKTSMRKKEFSPNLSWSSDLNTLAPLLVVLESSTSSSRLQI